MLPFVLFFFRSELNGSLWLMAMQRKGTSMCQLRWVCGVFCVLHGLLNFALILLLLFAQNVSKPGYLES